MSGTLLTAADILGAEDLGHKDIEVPEWKGTVRIRALSAEQGLKFQEILEDPDLKKAGKVQRDSYFQEPPPRQPKYVFSARRNVRRRMSARFPLPLGGEGVSGPPTCMPSNAKQILSRRAYYHRSLRDPRRGVPGGNYRKALPTLNSRDERGRIVCLRKVGRWHVPGRHR